MRIVIAIICLTIGSQLYGQSINEDPAITDLMNRYVAQNRAITNIKGFRIQIHSTTDRSKIQRMASEFSLQFPEFESGWINEAPYYKLKCCAFATKLDALPVLKRIQEQFPGAYTIVDNNIPIGEVQ